MFLLKKNWNDKKIMANRRDSVPSGEDCNSEVVCKADRSKAKDEPGIVGKEKKYNKHVEDALSKEQLFLGPNL